MKKVQKSGLPFVVQIINKLQTLKNEHHNLWHSFSKNCQIFVLDFWTSLKKRGFLCGYKPLLPARVSRRCFHFVQAIAFDSRQPSKGFIFLLFLSLCFFLFIRLLLCFWEWICVLFYTHFIHCYIVHFLLSNIFCNCRIIQSYCAYDGKMVRV